MAKSKDDGYGGEWIRENAREIISTYYEGITVRQLHYRLVARGFPNTTKHYKRVVYTTGQMRWDGDADFDDFVDHERDVEGITTGSNPTDLQDSIEQGIRQVRAWMNNYRRNRWENQPNYVEVWIEKKALQGVFESPCISRAVPLCPCKGYPSLTYLDDARKRFENAFDRDQEPVILYFGDHDPSGDDIPRSVEETLDRMGVAVSLDRIALTEDQVREWQLPPAPTKTTDSRAGSWNGVGQVELDAVEPHHLKTLVKDAIDRYFDQDTFDILKVEEDIQRDQYRKALRDFVEGFDE